LPANFDPADPTKTPPGSGAGGGGTKKEGEACTDDSSCTSGLICHGGKCSKSGGGGGGDPHDCTTGDKEVTRYPTCPDDFETKYNGKTFKINAGAVLDSRSIKFCDSGVDLKDPSVEYKIFGSALRGDQCWLLVEPSNNPNEDYYVKQAQVDKSTTISGGTVCKAPSIPLNFGSSEQTNASIFLKWDVVPEAEKYFVFMKGINMTDNSSINATYNVTGNNTYNVTGLLNNTFYLFNVTSFNSTMCINMSNATATINVTTLNSTIPVPGITPLITSFVKESDSYASIYLVWVVDGAFNSSNLTRNGTVIFSGNGSVTAFNDTGLLNGTGYYYQLNVTRNNVTESANATFMTREVTIAVSSFNLENANADSISMNWTVAGPYASSDLYRGEDIVYSGTGMNYTDTGLTPGTQYPYKVVVIWTPTVFNYSTATFSTLP
jgi:hypothetical protein